MAIRTTGKGADLRIVTKTRTNGRKISCSCCETFLAFATSAGGKLGCAMGPAIQTFLLEPPYNLAENREYKLKIEFTSADGQFHVGSFYEANLTFTPDVTITWEVSFENASDPWLVTNNGKTIRFTLEDSLNCGGTNDLTQTGIANATIKTSASVQMGFQFTGIAELEDTGFENISFFLEKA